MVDPDDENTWTIATLANDDGTADFADGPAVTARFREPTGLFFDDTARMLYVADTGNHVIRTMDVDAGQVSTVIGTPETLGFFGDDGLATEALLYQPQAITRCGNGDLFVADTGNHRMRRIHRVGSDDIITTVLGDGIAASSGEGGPAWTFPVDTPLGLGCDAFGNLFVTSRTTVRLLSADDFGVVDGEGEVQTIYGLPGDPFPASVTRCLTGLAIVDADELQVADSCTGILVELWRQPEP